MLRVGASQNSTLSWSSPRPLETGRAAHLASPEIKPTPQPPAHTTTPTACLPLLACTLQQLLLDLSARYAQTAKSDGMGLPRRHGTSCSPPP